jgi:hypothetical protein
MERMFDLWVPPTAMARSLPRERIARMKPPISPRSPVIRLASREQSRTSAREKPRINGMLDLQTVPSGDRWDRISEAIRHLDKEHGRRWRLKVLLPDAPETATEMPALTAQFSQAGLRYDSVREPGGVQGTVLAPREDEAVLIGA